MTDNIELPPLPTPMGADGDYTLTQVKEITRAAILADYARQAPAPVEVSSTMEECIQSIIRDLSELPDYTSPDEWPDALLATPDELRVVLERHLASMASTPVGDLARDFPPMGGLTECDMGDSYE